MSYEVKPYGFLFNIGKYRIRIYPNIIIFQNLFDSPSFEYEEYYLHHMKKDNDAIKMAVIYIHLWFSINITIKWQKEYIERINNDSK